MEPAERKDQISNLSIAILQTVPVMYRRLVRKNEMLEGNNGGYPKMGILTTIQRNGPLPLSAIAQLNSYSRQNLTTLTDRLEADGLVRRVPSASDRRVINLELTDTGREYISAHYKRIAQALMDELAGLDDSNVKVLLTSFENIEKLYLRAAEEPR
jgi:DNA-binding MarR family transcriptional regulator